MTFESEFETDAAHVNVNAGIAVVIPAQRLIDLLEEELVKDREDAESRADHQRPVATSDWASGDTAPPPSEFDRFEDLTRKIVNVPKKEIDEKRKNES